MSRPGRAATRAEMPSIGRGGQVTAGAGVRRAGLVALVGLGLAGCLGSPQPTTELLTLPRGRQAPAAEEIPADGPPLGLGPVTVAAHLERRYLAYRIDASRVEFADSAQWAAPLDQMVGQHLLTGLSDAVGARNLREHPWTASRAPEFQFTLHLDEFAVTPGGEGIVAARWSLRDPGTGRGLDGGSWERSIPAAGASASDQVSALTSALDALADFLVARLRAFEAGG